MRVGVYNILRRGLSGEEISRGWQAAARSAEPELSNGGRKARVVEEPGRHVYLSAQLSWESCLGSFGDAILCDCGCDLNAILADGGGRWRLMRCRREDRMKKSSLVSQWGLDLLRVAPYVRHSVSSVRHYPDAIAAHRAGSPFGGKEPTVAGAFLLLPNSRLLNRSVLLSS
jgi:hypothetical protein